MSDPFSSSTFLRISSYGMPATIQLEYLLVERQLGMDSNFSSSSRADRISSQAFRREIYAVRKATQINGFVDSHA